MVTGGDASQVEEPPDFKLFACGLCFLSMHSSHLYDPESPPTAPSLNYTRFVCISDTHSRTYHIPPGDVLLHAG